MGKKFLLTALLSSLSICLAPGASAKSAPASILEIAPLKGALGQPSLRGEFGLGKNYAVGIRTEVITATGESSELLDTHTRLGAHALWYPEGNSVQGFFVGAGLDFKHSIINRTRLRDSYTWDRTNANEMNDTWTNVDDKLLTTQFLGYRIAHSPTFTSSFRLMTDQIFVSSSSTKNEDLRSFNVDTASRNKGRIAQHFLLHTGIRFH
jgi:hypothetical protein